MSDVEPKTEKAVEEQSEDRRPKISQDAVLVESDDSICDKTQVVKGYDLNSGVDFDALLATYKFIGFQATNFGRAVEIVNEMLRVRDPKCKIFFSFTSNMISCGVREIIRFIAQHRLVDVIVTTGGAIEEDIMKCLADTFVGSFSLKGSMLRDRGVNRIGNLLVPNDNYVRFEQFLTPLLDEFLLEQKRDGYLWSPSRIIRRLGKEIDNPESVWYWCYKNNIPVYCPAITDGSIGDMLFFHSYNHPGLVVDLVSDIRGMNEEAIWEKRTGMLILGGGVVKHHVCNANLMRNGADYSVFINTAHEFDGSDAGARPDEAVSWGKIRADAESTKVHGDASLIFPLLASQTFAKYHYERVAAGEVDATGEADAPAESSEQ